MVALTISSFLLAGNPSISHSLSLPLSSFSPSLPLSLHPSRWRTEMTALTITSLQRWTGSHYNIPPLLSYTPFLLSYISPFPPTPFLFLFFLDFADRVIKYQCYLLLTLLLFFSHPSPLLSSLLTPLLSSPLLSSPLLSSLSLSFSQQS